MTVDTKATTVDPADIEDFAKYVDKLADDLNDKSRPINKICNLRDAEDDENYPRLGANSAGQTLRGKYEERRTQMNEAGGQLYGTLRGLAKAAKKIAEDYRTNQALNKASVDKIEAALSENIKAPKPETTTTQPSENPQAQA